MTNGRLALSIARWEFNRFFKLKDQGLALLLGLAIGFGAGAVGRWVKKSGDQPIRITVLPSERPLTAPPGSRFHFLSAEGKDEAALRAAVARRDLEGLLLIRSPDRAELVVSRDPPWRDQLTEIVSAARRQQRLAEMNLPPERLAAAMAPVRIDLKYEGSTPPTGRKPARIFATVVIGLMLYGLFMGSAYLFVGITGEKQLRVTEQVIAAVSPQTWIDGKILGLSAFALASALNTAVMIGLFMVIPRLLNGERLSLPAGLPGWPFMLVVLALALLGFLFWFTFFAATAATTDDPNASWRGVLLWLALLPSSLAFTAMSNPDSPAMRFLSLLPITSPTVLSARLVLTHVPAWEVATGIALLIGATLLMRRAAGKIFGMGVLMHGKEPSLREMWRWARET